MEHFIKVYGQSNWLRLLLACAVIDYFGADVCIDVDVGAGVRAGADMMLSDRCTVRIERCQLPLKPSSLR